MMGVTETMAGKVTVNHVYVRGVAVPAHSPTNEPPEGTISRPLMPRIHFTSPINRVLTAPFGDIHLLLPGSSRYDFCNESEAPHPRRSSAKGEVGQEMTRMRGVAK